jgi:hypothetical protein
MRDLKVVVVAVALCATALVWGGTAAGAAADPPPQSRSWDAARLANATPRDLVIDHRGLAYLRGASGTLTPHGHATPAVAPPLQGPAAPRGSTTPFAKPGSGGGDTTGPVVSDRSPANATSTSQTAVSFSARVTDPSGIRGVNFVITYPDGRTGSFSGSNTGGDTWGVSLSGFTPGSWGWHIVAKDGAGKSGNTTTTDKFSLSITTQTSPPDNGSNVIANATWTDTSAAVRTATGRVFFSMPANKRLTRWVDYVCSGSVAADSTSNNVSVIITAAHCIYDDANKAFARNVIFIPNQASTTAGGSDRDCTNDPIGCWAPTAGVVDSNYTTRTFPNNSAWDYGYYVVPTSGAHLGSASSSDSLEVAAGTLPVSFAAPKYSPVDASGTYTHAIGYSYSEDPKLQYCAQDMTQFDAINWWLGSCGLSGGSSGGPWVQPLSGGTGPVISVNSWGYTNQPGMAGPKLSGTSAGCLFALSTSVTADTASTC